LKKLRALWWRISGSLWFVPSLIVIALVALAVWLIDAGKPLDLDLAERWPRVFGAGAEGARGMLSAIASSMITVAGVVFSVTIVALSLAASQYSPRVLRSFMADRPTQVVLGMFVGIFAYCLTVLRTIRGGEEEAYVPSVAVLGGMVLAFAGIGLLVFFIHHLAASIEASAILERQTAATLRALDDLFPENLGEPVEDPGAAEQQAGPWTAVAASTTGYIVSVDDAALLEAARDCGRVLRMEHGIGDFIIEGLPLASFQGARAVTDDDAAAVNACYALDRQRTVEQDVGFGIQQIVDIGLRALSPGINDPSTACMCIDRLTEVLVRLARRRIEPPLRRDGGTLRVIALGPSFAALASLAWRPLRHAAREQPAVLERLRWSVDQVSAAARDPGRRETLGIERRCLNAA
jgi:uncharacterized membrane protein